jgi:hypothetical protein
LRGCTVGFSLQGLLLRNAMSCRNFLNFSAKK